MESWQTLYTLAQDAVQDESSSVLTDLKADINEGIGILETEMNLPPLEKTRDYTTTTSNIYALPQNYSLFKEVYPTISSVRYPSLIRVYDEESWNIIRTMADSISSNIPTHVFVRPGSWQFEIHPTPSSAGNTLTLVYEAVEKALSADDYVTGTITTLANAGTAITFSGTTLTAAMVDRWIKLPDGEWYLLSTFTDTTHMSIKQLYQGTAIVAGSSSFTIGEMSRLPRGRLQRAPVSYAAMRYFSTKRRDTSMYKLHKSEWLEAVEVAKTHAQKYVSAIVPSARRIRGAFTHRNPNAYPQSLS